MRPFRRADCWENHTRTDQLQVPGAHTPYEKGRFCNSHAYCKFKIRIVGNFSALASNEAEVRWKKIPVCDALVHQFRRSQSPTCPPINFAWTRKKNSEWSFSCNQLIFGRFTHTLQTMERLHCGQHSNSTRARSTGSSHDFVLNTASSKWFAKHRYLLLINDVNAIHSIDASSSP